MDICQTCWVEDLLIIQTQYNSSIKTDWEQLADVKYMLTKMNDEEPTIEDCLNVIKYVAVNYDRLIEENKELLPKNLKKAETEYQRHLRLQL